MRPSPVFGAGIAPAGSRGFLFLAARGGAVVLVGLAAYIAVQVWLRTEWRQKRSIRRRLFEIEDVGPQPGALGTADEASLWMRRPERLAFLRSCIEGTPSGPLVVTGPEGAGKSTLLRQAMHGRAMCWFLDSREVPVSSGEQLLTNFIARTGYLAPPDELLGQVVFARPSDPAKLKADKDKALRLVTEVLRDVQRQQGEAVAAATAAATAAIAAAQQAQHDQDAAVAASKEGAPAAPDASQGTAVQAASASSRPAQHGGAGAAAASATKRPSADSAPSASRAPTGADSSPQQRAAAATVIGALERAKAKRASNASTAELFERSWLLATVARTSMDLLERLAAVSPPVITRVAEAIHSGIKSIFAVELAEDEATGGLPSTLPPLICLDEVHIIGDASDASFHALLDWTQYLTDQRLAHVVIGCSADFAERLDAVRSFRNRRQRIHVDFPRSVSLRGFLAGPVNSELARRSRAARAAVALTVATDPAVGAATSDKLSSALSSEEVAAFSGLEDVDVDWLTSLPPEDLPAAARLRPLTAHEINTVVATVGGHMKDLDQIIRHLSEGHPLSAVLERMVADSVDSVETYIEGALLQGEPLLPGLAFGSHGGEAAGGAAKSHHVPKDMVERAWRFVRLWRLMELLSKRKYVSRRELTTGLFAGHGWELDELTSQGIVMCANLRSTRKYRASTAKPSSSQPADQDSAGQSPSASRSTSPSGSAAGGKPAERAGHPLSADLPTADALSASTRYVAAASPRLRAAFRVITENRSLKEQSDRVAAMLRAGVLRSQIDHLDKRLAAVASERSYYAHRFEKFADTIDPMADVADLPTRGQPRAAASSITHGVGRPMVEGPEACAERRAQLRRALEALESDGRRLRLAIAEAHENLEHAELVAEGPSRANLLLNLPEGPRV
ncbi:hypothetical protein FNF31_05381 [Cafeteria roenbergensis]|uniref:Uncharacterized protein n=1 Tax=Cafeteria roenbergensis TaxID=33653 RepID=A0A5A8DF51_CAFRO|nr:hypothetical protein FNF31_05381 [Cafeteria roenbergensis]KAA0163945.1 hypothetical protein FNF28_04051 [Cafeteria roenbergensis]